MQQILTRGRAAGSIDILPQRHTIPHVWRPAGASFGAITREPDKVTTIQHTRAKRSRAMIHRSDLRQLQSVNEYPSVSILAPTHRTSPDNKQDPIRVKNLVAETKNRLLGEFSAREMEPLFTKLDALVERIDYERLLDGL